MGNLFQELKRRKVFRVAAVYAVVAWLLIEVTSTILPTFDTPAWVNQTVTLLLILGFPIALVLSWAYEVTPEGIKSDAGTQPATASAQSTDRNLIYIILALVVMVAGFQLSDRFFSDDSNSATRSAGSGSVSSNPTVLRASINLNQSLRPGPLGFSTILSLAPDGSMLAYTDWPTGRLLLRNLATQETQEFMVGRVYPQFSPNSQNLLVLDLAIFEYSIMPAQGGGLRPLPIEAARAAWLSDEEILYQLPDFSFRIFSLADETDEPVPNFVAQDESGFFVPLPGRGAFFFDKTPTLRAQNQLEIQIYDLDNQSTTLVTNDGYHAQYVNSGHVVFMRRGDLWAVPFDIDALEVEGPEARISQGVEGQHLGGGAAYSVSDSGRLVYLPGPEFVPNQTILVWADRSGRQEDIRLPAGVYAEPRISPDGELLALTSRQADGSTNIWVYDFSRETFGPRTFSGNALNPVWDAGGSRLFYQESSVLYSGGNSLGDIWVMNADGTGQAERILSAAARIDSFSQSDEKIIYTSLDSEAFIGLLNTLTFSDDAWVSAPLLHNDFGARQGTVSPDGRWIAYMSTESGTEQIYVQAYPSLDGKWAISSGEPGSNSPSWGPNSDELFFVRVDGTLVHTEITIEGDSFSPGIVEPLISDLGASTFMNTPTYSISNDAERFFHIKGTVDEPDTGLDQSRTELVMVENFFEELKRLAPADAQ